MPALHDPAGEPGPESDRRLHAALAQLEVVGELDAVGAGVEQRDVHDVGGEGAAHPFADQLDQGVEVELGGEGLHDAVDRLELDRPLPGLRERADALEGGADVLRDVGEQVAIGVGVSDGGGVGLHRQDADDPPPCLERHADPFVVAARGPDQVHLTARDETIPVRGRSSCGSPVRNT